MAKKSKNLSNDEDIEVVEKEESQIDQIPKTYVLLDGYWDTIDKNLPKNSNALMRYIGVFRNKNIDILETPYPVDYPPWIPSNTRVLYQVTGVREGDFVRSCMTIRGYDGYEDPYLKSKAVNIMLNLIARWYLMNNRNKEYQVIKYFIGYNYYWSVFTRYFKKYKPKLEVMKYTINELSYKNALKSAGSVDKWLYVGVSDSLDSYKDRLLRGSDWELLYIGDKIRSKFDGYFKKLYPLQEKNEREKNYIFTSKTVVDDVITDNTAGVAEILSISDSYTTKFFSEPISESAISSARFEGGITERDLRNTILLIADNRDNYEDVRKFYQSIFYLFLSDTKYRARDIGTLKFYYEMKRLYTPGNSNDPNKTFIKEIMDKWLKIGSGTYRVSNRADTLNKFRKSIYEYFIHKILIDH